MRLTLAVQESRVMELEFSQIEQFIERGRRGLYMIYLRDATPLKVGIAGDLRRRLMHHRRSPDSGLRLKPGGDRSRPEDVECKRSILGKHLYYDEEIAPGYDLKTQAGRQAFLRENCTLRVLLTQTRAEARELEKQWEATGQFRYVGLVRIRPSAA